jgi:hypothetical protein
MVKMSLPAVPQELTLEQLELCLIALDVFHGLINNSESFMGSNSILRTNYQKFLNFLMKISG